MIFSATSASMTFRTDIEEQLRRIDPKLTQEFDLDRIVEHAAPAVQPSAYKQSNAVLLAQIQAIRSRNASAAALCLKYATRELLERFSIENARVNLPASVRELYVRELDRIRDQLARANLEFYDLDNDPFAKDLAILTHRFIPIGAEFVEPDAGVPRSAALRGGARQLLAGALFMLLRARGFKPFFALHAHPLALQDFNPEGWNRSYHRLAELLEKNPEVKGMISASWFLDPQLKTISPRLRYLREVPEHNGAAFFFLGHDREGDSGALAKSATRRGLFEQGRYVPAIFMRVWLRRDILAWSRRNRSGAPFDSSK
jgi:hypothetical protein